MNKITKILIVVALIAAGASSAYAVSSYMTSFTSTYPAAASTALNSCTLCHPSYPSSYARNSYGTAYANNGRNYVTIQNLDSDGDGFTNLAEINAGTFPGNAASKPVAADTTAPAVSAFTIPATATSLTVSVTSFTASDNVGVTGYLITESAAAPAAGAAGWSATAPASYVFASAGAKTLYAWAKDAAGNVSASRSAAVTITLPDATAPAVSTFTIPATATSLTVSVTAFTASDNVGVTGYLITESAAAPAAGAAGWSATAPASYTFAAGTANGAKTLYAWAKDATGNVSASRSASVTLNVPDATAPTVSTFTIPATATSLTVSVTAFTATDNIGVSGYMVTASATAPAAGAAGWSATAPSTYVFPAGTANGSKTLYAWAKDAAGNVSASKSAGVTISIDSTAPSISAFTVPANGVSLTVYISSFVATDNVGVSGYIVTASATAPAAGAAGWSATAPSTYVFPAGTANGSKTLYAWAKDAAGNVSASRSATIVIDTTKAGAIAQMSVFRSGMWYIDVNSNLAWDSAVDGAISFGMDRDIPVAGDWNGDGNRKMGVFRHGIWYLDLNGNNLWDAGTDVSTHFGMPTDVPVAGDWNGDGRAKIGVFRDGYWYLDYNGNNQWDGCGAPADSAKDVCVQFGMETDLPVVGDWNGDGRTKIGVFRSGTWYLDTTGNVSWDPGIDVAYTYGMEGDIPVAGDWNGDGKAKIGVFRNGTWYIDMNGNNAWDAGVDQAVVFGMATDQPVVK